MVSVHLFSHADNILLNCLPVLFVRFALRIFQTFSRSMYTLLVTSFICLLLLLLPASYLLRLRTVLRTILVSNRRLTAPLHPLCILSCSSMEAWLAEALQQQAPTRQPAVPDHKKQRRGQQVPSASSQTYTSALQQAHVEATLDLGYLDLEQARNNRFLIGNLMHIYIPAQENCPP